MSFTITHDLKTVAGGKTIQKSNEYTGSGHHRVDEDIADSTTDQEITFNLDISALKAITMVADQDVTVETNNGSTPGDTFNLKADQPLMWNSGDSYFSNPFSTDVTALFVTNASGSSANLRVEAVEDATP